MCLGQRLGRLGRVAGRWGVRRAGFELAIGPRARALQTLEKLFPRDTSQKEYEKRVVLEAVAEQHGERADVRAWLLSLGAGASEHDVAGVKRQERAARFLEGALHVFGEAARQKVGRVPRPRCHRLEDAAPDRPVERAKRKRRLLDVSPGRPDARPRAGPPDLERGHRA